MFNWKDFERNKQVFAHVGGDCYSDELGQHHLKVRPNELLDWMEFLKDDMGYFTITEVAGIDLGNSQFEVIYQLLNMGLHQRMNVHLLVNDGEVIPSIVKFFPNADWPEREQAEMLNLVFNKPMPALVLPEEQNNFPLRIKNQIKNWPPAKTTPLPKVPFNPNKSEAPYPEEKNIWKRFDLVSPITKGNFEWDVCFDPVYAVDSQIRIGYHHQGLERFLQGKDLFQIIHLVDKINLSSAPQYSIGWAKTIEDMFRIKIPERAQAIRIVMLELARVADHLTVLHGICFESGQNEAKLFLNAREKISELFEKFTGHRHGLGVAKIGGTSEDLPHGWIVEYQSVLEILSKNLRTIHNSLVGQIKFRENLEGGPVSAHSVLKSGVTGPAMRAAGLNFDLRKSQPFYFYQDIDFDVPVGIHGTTYDRYLIRYEEIFQSLRIITQVIDNLPLGQVVAENFNKNYAEVTEFFHTLEKPLEWYYCGLESPSGEAGYLVKFSDTLKPERVKIKTPGFGLASAMPVFMKGLKESQLKACLASLGISRWEMDR